jgi:hypothetical protein
MSEEIQTKDPTTSVTCSVSALFAFKIGDEIDLDRLGELNLGQQEVPEFNYRNRTPGHLTLPPAIGIGVPFIIGMRELDPGCNLKPVVDLTIFRAGAITVRFEFEFKGSLLDLRKLSLRLQSDANLRNEAELHAKKMAAKLKPITTRPEFVDDFEDYFIFDIPTGDGPEQDGEKFVQRNAAVIAGILRGETAELSMAEIKEATTEQTAYFKEDRVIIAWNDEALVLEFACVQLLLIRLLHGKIEKAAVKTRGLLEEASVGKFQSMKALRRQLRETTDQHLDLKSAIDAVTNEFEFVGDQYLARVYRLAVRALAMNSWETQLREKASIVNDAQQQLSGHAHHEQGHRLELIVIRLIVVEVIVGLIELAIGIAQLIGLIGGHGH